MTKEQLLYGLGEVLTAAQILRRQAVFHDVSIDKTDAAWKTLIACHRMVYEEIDNNLAIRQLSENEKQRWNFAKGTAVIDGLKQETTQVTATMRKHTCGIDNTVPEYQFPCQACVEESRQEKREGTIVNPVCSKCGKPMVEPLPGEPYLCNNSTCMGKLPSGNVGQSHPSRDSDQPITDERLEELREACQWICGREDYDTVYGNVDIRQVADLLIELREFRSATQTAPVDSADPERLLKILAGFKADLANCYGQMGGRAMKSTLEQCQKDVDVLLELVKAGQESKEAGERYKDRLAEVTGHCLSRYTGLVDGSAVASFVNMAVGVLTAIDKRCEERNR